MNKGTLATSREHHALPRITQLPIQIQSCLFFSDLDSVTKSSLSWSNTWIRWKKKIYHIAQVPKHPLSLTLIFSSSVFLFPLARISAHCQKKRDSPWTCWLPTVRQHFNPHRQALSACLVAEADPWPKPPTRPRFLLCSFWPATLPEWKTPPVFVTASLQGLLQIRRLRLQHTISPVSPRSLRTFPC